MVQDVKVCAQFHGPMYSNHLHIIWYHKAIYCTVVVNY